jgi:septum formation protein
MSALILASTSETRRQILVKAGVDFASMSPMVDEEALKAGFLDAGLDGRSLADALAEAKAIKLSAKNPTALVIGADQVLVTEAGQILDKPESPDIAKAHLRLLSGQGHRLYSAVVIAAAGVPVWRHIAAPRLSMRNLSDAFIHDYVERHWQDIRHSVGCYQIEAAGAQLFVKVDGDHFEIMGLPLFPILAFLREREILPS